MSRAHAKPYVRLVTDSGNGESQLTRMFDAEINPPKGGCFLC